jgi:hypothetical protein
MRAIRTSDINFDISPDGLIQLKQGKVKKHIIAAMQDLQLRRNNARAASNTNTKGIVPERVELLARTSGLEFFSASRSTSTMLRFSL